MTPDLNILRLRRPPTGIPVEQPGVFTKEHQLLMLWQYAEAGYFVWANGDDTYNVSSPMFTVPKGNESWATRKPLK